MKKKVFRERQVAEKLFDMKYDEVIKSAKEINLEKEIKSIVEEAVEEEKPVKRGRKKSVKSDK